jgi:RHS repeat-associated protein
MSGKPATGQSPNYSEYPLPGGSVLSQGGGAHGVQMADWLGTIRAFWIYTGGSYSTSSAHAPFGESYGSTGGYATGFAGEAMGDGDPTNTTYWFPERHLRSSQGRWLSPDPAGLGAVEPGNPQSWNRYAYVGNSPLNNIDPQGLQGNTNDQFNEPTSAGDCSGGESICLNLQGLVNGVDEFDLLHTPVRGWRCNGDCGWYVVGNALSFIDQARTTGHGPFSFLSKVSAANNGQQPKPCANVPKSPPGASATFNANLVSQETQGMWPATKLDYFYQVFRTGGTFDFKATGGDQYVDYGNWNFGYVCGANYPALFCQSAAGANRMSRAAMQGTNPFGSGVPFVKSPYGDQAADNQQIRNGIQAQASGCVQ